MKLSLQGYVRNHKNVLNTALHELKENDEDVSHAVYTKLEGALNDANDIALTLYDIIMALLRKDIGRDEAVEFLCLDDDKLKNHKHTNDLITFKD